MAVSCANAPLKTQTRESGFLAGRGVFRRLPCSRQPAGCLAVSFHRHGRSPLIFSLFDGLEVRRARTDDRL
jgi:hypothetical protein